MENDKVIEVVVKIMKDGMEHVLCPECKLKMFKYLENMKRLFEDELHVSNY